MSEPLQRLGGSLSHVSVEALQPEATSVPFPLTSEREGQERKAGRARSASQFSIFSRLSFSRPASQTASEGPSGAKLCQGGLALADGRLQTSDPVLTALMDRARLTCPDLDDMIAPHWPEGDVQVEIAWDKTGQECRAQLDAACQHEGVSILLPAMMLAQDRAPRCGFQADAVIGEGEAARHPYEAMRGVPLRVTCSACPELGQTLERLLNDDATEEMRVRLLAHDVYRSLTEKDIEVLPTVASILWSVAIGVGLDVMAGPQVFGAIDQRFGHESAAARVMKVLYNLLPSFIAESGDATINYTLLDAMKPGSAITSVQGFFAALAQRLPDGLCTGAMSAAVSPLSSAMQAVDGGVPLEKGRAFGVLNAFMNIFSSEVQYLGAALPILQQPFEDKAQLLNALEQHTSAGGLVHLPQDVAAKDLARAAMSRDSSNGIAQAAILPGMGLALIYALLGSGRIFRNAPLMPERAFAAAQVATYNPWEAIGATGAIMVSRLHWGRLMHSDSQKYAEMACRIARDEALGLPELSRIDSKWNASAGAVISDTVAGWLEKLGQALKNVLGNHQETSRTRDITDSNEHDVSNMPGSWTVN